MSSDLKLPSSFRDPSGFLFKRDGILYRQVNQAYRADYEHMMASDLFRELADAGHVIPIEEVRIEPADPALAYKILKPEPIRFVSYPYEWCFSQYKDAARTTLAIQKHALERGMSLKDCSAYNIQFHQGRPVLIDSLSLEIYREGEPWTAYRQFCQHFLGPLALMAHRDVRLGQLMRVYLDGIPLDLVSGLLPFASRVDLGLLTHIHVHSMAQRHYEGKTVDKSHVRGRMGRTAFMGLLESLEATVSKLSWRPAGTEWAEYYDQTNYTPAALSHKQDIVRGFLEQIRPSTVWDLGANTGLFSRLASSLAIPTIAWDMDPAAVERNYRASLSEGEKWLLPLLIDLSNPSPGIGWQNQERQSFLERAPADAVMALALIHHLAIGNNVPFVQIADLLSRLGQWVIIEFVPKEDSQVKRLLSMRKDIFPDYRQDAFEKAFEEKFALHRRAEIHESSRILYLFQSRQ